MASSSRRPGKEANP
uniref:Uncharacterized protein n=1 Tax=Arundo donax TaxID=35708 RepID=A0A0A8ZLM8_ARUDO